QMAEILVDPTDCAPRLTHLQRTRVFEHYIFSNIEHDCGALRGDRPRWIRTYLLSSGNGVRAAAILDRARAWAADDSMGRGFDHIVFDTNYYSVPYKLVHEMVEVRSTPTTVERFHKGRRVASHLRARGHGHTASIAEHRPRSHQEHLEWMS